MPPGPNRLFVRNPNSRDPELSSELKDLLKKDAAKLFGVLEHPSEMSDVFKALIIEIDNLLNDDKSLEKLRLFEGKTFDQIKQEILSSYVFALSPLINNIALDQIVGEGQSIASATPEQAMKIMNTARLVQSVTGKAKDLYSGYLQDGQFKESQVDPLATHEPREKERSVQKEIFVQPSLTISSPKGFKKAASTPEMFFAARTRADQLRRDIKNLKRWIAATNDDLAAVVEEKAVLEQKMRQDGNDKITSDEALELAGRYDQLQDNFQQSLKSDREQLQQLQAALQQLESKQQEQVQQQGQAKP